MMVRCVPSLFIAAALVAFASPVAVAAKEVDWKKIFQGGAARKHELDSKGECGGVPTAEFDARREVSREYARRAAGLDFAIHSILESMPEHARKTPPLVEDAVDAYQRSFDCIPSYEHRHLLEAADELLAFAQVKFRARQQTDEQVYVAHFQELRDGVFAKMPQPPATGDCSEPRRRCDGPAEPPVLDTRGCSLDTDRTCWPLVAVALLWARRRRR